jgi:hypothetical protein
MTPPRLSEVRCPRCDHVSWVIDSDAVEIGGQTLPYSARRYDCASCGYGGPGWKVEQQSPPAFLLQPHNLYPMTKIAFDYWVEILRTHFPEHPALTRLGTTFFPRLPEEVEARRDAHARAHQVVEMIAQDGARRAEPDLRVADEWLEIMTPGDTLAFRRRDGGTLQFWRETAGHVARCSDEAGAVVTEAGELDDATVREAVQRYLQGDTTACVRRLRTHA